MPNRTQGGQRRYSDEHAFILERVKMLREKGTSLAEIREIFNNRGNRMENPSGSENIDFLSNHIAEIVRIEINRFLLNRKLP